MFWSSLQRQSSHARTITVGTDLHRTLRPHSNVADGDASAPDQSTDKVVWNLHPHSLFEIGLHMIEIV